MQRVLGLITFSLRVYLIWLYFAKLAKELRKLPFINVAKIFELPSKDGNITPEKARKSRQMHFCAKTAYVWGLRYQWAPSPTRALFATLPPSAQYCSTVAHFESEHSKYVYVLSLLIKDLGKGDMTHSQMFQKVEYGLAAKIWRLVGCTKMISW